MVRTSICKLMIIKMTSMTIVKKTTKTVTAQLVSRHRAICILPSMATFYSCFGVRKYFRNLSVK